MKLINYYEIIVKDIFAPYFVENVIQTTAELKSDRKNAIENLHKAKQYVVKSAMEDVDIQKASCIQHCHEAERKMLDVIEDTRRAITEKHLAIPQFIDIKLFESVDSEIRKAIEIALTEMSKEQVRKINGMVSSINNLFGFLSHIIPQSVEDDWQAFKSNELKSALPHVAAKSVMERILTDLGEQPIHDVDAFLKPIVQSELKLLDAYRADLQKKLLKFFMDVYTIKL